MLVIGNFGYSSKQIDGQTIKTREFYSALCNVSTDNNFIDLDNYQKKPLLVFLLFFYVLKHKEIYFLPGVNALKLLSPVLFIMSFFFKREINYVVIGGWLPSLVNQNSRINKIVGKFNRVYVELPSMVEDLQKMGFKNSVYLPNFRNINPETESKIDINISNRIGREGLKLVFFSRVIEEKGIFDALRLYAQLKEKYKDIILDVYGPLSGNSTNKILESIDLNGASYKGVINPGASIYITLSEYDFFLFPTKYEGEGFPGALIDSLMSGVIPLVTDWKYNKEIMQLIGLERFCFEQNNYIDSAKKNIDDVVENSELASLYIKCVESSKSFHAQKAVNIVLENKQ